jgi:hypothetical protein
MQQAIGDNAYDEERAEREAREAERAALELQKANERAAVMAALRGMPYEIQPIGDSLEASLNNLETQMKIFTQSTLSTGLVGGLEGKTANAARSKIEGTTIPDFPNPVKV